MQQELGHDAVPNLEGGPQELGADLPVLGSVAEAARKRRQQQLAALAAMAQRASAGGQREQQLVLPSGTIFPPAATAAAPGNVLPMPPMDGNAGAAESAVANASGKPQCEAMQGLPFPPPQQPIQQQSAAPFGSCKRSRSRSGHTGREQQDRQRARSIGGERHQAPLSSRNCSTSASTGSTCRSSRSWSSSDTEPLLPPRNGGSRARIAGSGHPRALRESPTSRRSATPDAAAPVGAPAASAGVLRRAAAGDKSAVKAPSGTICHLRVSDRCGLYHAHMCVQSCLHTLAASVLTCLLLSRTAACGASLYRPFGAVARLGAFHSLPAALRRRWRCALLCRAGGPSGWLAARCNPLLCSHPKTGPPIELFARVPAARATWLWVPQGCWCLILAAGVGACLLWLPVPCLPAAPALLAFSGSSCLQFTLVATFGPSVQAMQREGLLQLDMTESSSSRWRVIAAPELFAIADGSGGAEAAAAAAAEGLGGQAVNKAAPISWCHQAADADAVPPAASAIAAEAAAVLSVVAAKQQQAAAAPALAAPLRFSLRPVRRLATKPGTVAQPAAAAASDLAASLSAAAQIPASRPAAVVAGGAPWPAAARATAAAAIVEQETAAEALVSEAASAQAPTRPAAIASPAMPERAEQPGPAVMPEVAPEKKASDKRHQPNTLPVQGARAARSLLAAATAAATSIEAAAAAVDVAKTSAAFKFAAAAVQQQLHQQWQLTQRSQEQQELQAVRVVLLMSSSGDGERVRLLLTPGLPPPAPRQAAPPAQAAAMPAASSKQGQPQGWQPAAPLGLHAAQAVLQQRRGSDAGAAYGGSRELSSYADLVPGAGAGARGSSRASTGRHLPVFSTPAPGAAMHAQQCMPSNARPIHQQWQPQQQLPLHQLPAVQIALLEELKACLGSSPITMLATEGLLAPLLAPAVLQTAAEDARAGGAAVAAPTPLTLDWPLCPYELRGSCHDAACR